MGGSPLFKKYSGNVSGILMRPGIASRGKPCRTRAERLLKQKSCGNSRGFLRIALLTCNGGQPSIQKNTVAISRGFLRTALLTCNGGQPPIQKQYSGMSRSFLQIAAVLTCNGGKPSIQKNTPAMFRES